MNIRISVLVDNKSVNSEFLSEHGLSFWIEIGKNKILFDTGQSDNLIENAGKLAIDIAEADAVVLSHGHYDHTGGLIAVFDASQKAKLFLHPKAIKPKYSFKNQKSRIVGMSGPSLATVKSLEAGDRVFWTEKSREIVPGLFVTGQIPRQNDFEDTGGKFYLEEKCTIDDMIIDDQAVFFKSEKGLVVVLGCAHAGVVNTLDYIAEMTGEKQIYAVLGGMHLLHAGAERMNRTIEAIKKYDIQSIGLAHCTGEDAMQKLRDVFGSICFECIAGSQFEF